MHTGPQHPPCICLAVTPPQGPGQHCCWCAHGLASSSSREGENILQVPDKNNNPSSPSVTRLWVIGLRYKPLCHIPLGMPLESFSSSICDLKCSLNQSCVQGLICTCSKVKEPYLWRALRPQSSRMHSGDSARPAAIHPLPLHPVMFEHWRANKKIHILHPSGHVVFWQGLRRLAPQCLVLPQVEWVLQNPKLP